MLLDSVDSLPRIVAGSPAAVPLYEEVPLACVEVILDELAHLVLFDIVEVPTDIPDAVSSSFESVFR